MYESFAENKNSTTRGFFLKLLTLYLHNTTGAPTHYFSLASNIWRIKPDYHLGRADRLQKNHLVSN